ncbi:tetratricopeptide repeat-containing response regulator [Motiliproteus sp. MSK22-1]|uniref:tetratricopeptide repeat-containing response regulator n=1 Tax=Motiliproteus sp. MSK22-1 TaxID=1897630 RepID=UPI0009759A27|nr:tetratricopeptide repeat-containing response regulator [Motiliproteus sp. MSK22-1]OMH38331.1 hypothetical protein BGP75_08815 [Motiliproteus sp. MSK22-1]
MSSFESDYSQLKFLIVDDFPSFCGAQRTMLMSFGANDIDMVLHGEDAIRAISKKRYDVVLCDYNLGEGKNGNDVLEEAKHHKLLKSSALFMMITAESGSEMVRGALEYQPDDYLTKPFTKEVLQTRLQRLLERNRIFQPVYRAMDKEDIRSAVTLCDKIVEANRRYKRYAQRLKSQLLFDQEEYGQAEVLCAEVLREKHLPWAVLGLGKSHFYQKNYPKAEQYLHSLLDEDKGYVQAWDWLARCQEQRGDTEGAQASLEEAVKTSPVNVRRQTHLGDLAMRNGDVQQAEKAYSRSVKVGKHSVFRSPESYMKLTEILVDRLDGSQGLAGKVVETKALEAMDELRHFYKDDAKIGLTSRLMDNKIHTIRGHKHEAEKAIFRAYDLCAKDKEGTLPAAMKEELLVKLEALGRKDMVEKVVAAMQAEESNHNTQAISLYDQGDIGAALEVLKQAVTEKPRSYSICLNTAQVAIHYMIKNGVQQELLDLAEGALERSASLSEDDRRFKLHGDLSRRLGKLKQRVVS